MIKITEILPNPEGKDGNNEWIELTNLGKQPINLENYTLDDIIEGGSKPYTFSANTLLQPNQPIAFYKSQTKLNLNNSGDEVRLLSPNKEPVDQINYDKSEEGASYALTTILTNKGEKSTYRWTAPTPNKENQPLYLFEGTITSPPEIKSNFSFEFQPAQEDAAGVASISELSPAPAATPTQASLSAQPKAITITFTEETLDFENAKIIFQPQTKAKLLTSKISNSKFSLVDYKIQTSSQQNTLEPANTPTQTPKTQPLPTFLFPILITILILLIFALKLSRLKKKKN